MGEVPLGNPSHERSSNKALKELWGTLTQEEQEKFAPIWERLEYEIERGNRNYGMNRAALDKVQRDEPLISKTRIWINTVKNTGPYTLEGMAALEALWSAAVKHHEQETENDS